MKKLLITVLLLITSSTYSFENSWRECWLNGLKYFEEKQYVEAREMFQTAITAMAEEEFQQNPYVLIDLAHVNYMLGNVDDTLRDAFRLVSIQGLSDLERLISGNYLVSALWVKGYTEEAVEAYLKYIERSPIIPKYHFEKNKIIIRNVLDCDWYKDWTKQLMLLKYCENEHDIHEYGNIWVIDITKQNDFLDIDEDRTPKNLDFTKSASRPVLQKKTLQQIEGCCNTCDLLAVGANVICGCLALPEVLAGPWTSVVCTLACMAFVEQSKQDCKACCRKDPQECGHFFKEWKDLFKRDYPNCPKPDCRDQ